MSEHINEMHLQTKGHGTHGANQQQPIVYPGLEVYAYGVHVANDLAGRLLEGEVDTALASPAGSFNKVVGKACLSSSCRS